MKTGLSKVEIKQYFRKKEELVHTNEKTKEKQIIEPALSKSSEIQFGQITFQRPGSKKPWQDKKFGWIPNATTPKAVFMNVLLPLFYQSMVKFSRSSCEFVSAFHAEARRQWDTKCRITRLENRVSAILKPENPAAAGKYFDEHYILSPSNQIVLKSNLAVIKRTRECNQKEEEMAKRHFSGLFAKSGKFCLALIVRRNLMNKPLGKFETLMTNSPKYKHTYIHTYIHIY